MQTPTITPARVYREFTPEEAARYAEVLKAVENEKKEIIARGRLLMNDHKAAIEQLRKASQVLKAEREKQGLSLADVEQRSGIDQEQLSKVENEPQSNPSVITLIRYAEALGKNLSIALIDK